MAATTALFGAGLGLRRPLMGPLAGRPDAPIDFLEVAPENWLGVGGAEGRRFAALAERYPVVCHGLSLSLGGPAPLDEGFLQRLRGFMDHHGVPLYSEHLSYCHDGGHLYELLPLPFTGEAVRHIATRITRTQEVLGRRIAVENVSYYAAQPGEMDEGEFIAAVLAEADCDLLLDVNNLYVNAVNHGLDAGAVIAMLPPERVAYIHVAGHRREADDLVIDTHGATVVDPVWALLEQVYTHLGPLPTLLERDFNLPPLDELFAEVAQIATRQHSAQGNRRHARQAHA